MFFFARTRKFVEVVGWICIAILSSKGLLSIWEETPVSAAQENSSLVMASESASVPLYLDYEGYLTDMDGAPLTGYYTVTLRIYDDVAATFGDELWTEVHPNVPVRDGWFSVLLGNNTVLPENLFDLPDRFIGATVAPFDELVPRQRLASVPYAVHADHAASLNAPDGSPTDAVFVDNEGNVGIGTTSPGQRLHVFGNSFFEGSLGIGVTNPQSDLDIAGTLNVLSGGITALNIGSNGNAFMFGNVGIGTSNPQAKLDVEGNLNFSGQKGCSIVSIATGDSWRDILLVPSGWTTSTCSTFKNEIVGGGGYYQLFCVFENTYSRGDTSGGIPNPNCGW